MTAILKRSPASKEGSRSICLSRDSHPTFREATAAS
jgi:hypothetical protein